MGGPPAANPDEPKTDTAEKIQISSLSLLKMMKHGRAGVPMEVMGLMLGQFIDEYTITCIDVFAMPQHGTGVSVEAVDEAYQAQMLDMLKQTGRPETLVGWYHSHPGFGCWLSGVDMSTQMMFEKLDKRLVAVVIDPVQSVKGKVVIDAFRMIPGVGTMMMPPPGFEPRQTTSNIGFLRIPTMLARMHGLDRLYYQVSIDWRKNDFEEQMLMNLHKKEWSRGLHVSKFDEHQKTTETAMESMRKLSVDYVERVKQEEGVTPEEMEVKNVGKVDPKRHLDTDVHELMASCIVQALGTMINTVVF